MKSVEETRRELFETWALTDAWLGLGEEPERFEGGYLEFETHTAWLAFNAALDAVEIKLPESCKMTTEELNEGYDAGFLKWEILDSIESLNLGIKIK